MNDLDKLTIDEKINFVRKNRWPLIIYIRDTDYYLQMGSFDKGTFHEFIDDNFMSLIDRAYSVSETEVRSWGY